MDIAQRLPVFAREISGRQGNLLENGAPARRVVHQRSDRPDEIELSVRQERDSAPLDDCVLTATGLWSQQPWSNRCSMTRKS